jgi:cytochrome c
MKNCFLFITFCFLMSCKKENLNSQGLKPEITLSKEELGKELFEGKGNCAACHQMNEKTIGPSIKTIAKIYKNNNGNLIDFLKYDSKPIVDPSQYEVMKTNFSITKAMSDEDLKAIETYFYSSKAEQ